MRPATWSRTSSPRTRAARRRRRQRRRSSRLPRRSSTAPLRRGRHRSHRAGRWLRRSRPSSGTLTPSTRTADLVAGHRAVLDGVAADVIALGPALPVSRRSRIGVPVGVRANLALALQRGRFDIVHGFEPALPSLSYLALRDSHALGVATFLSAERLGYPPGKPQRERLLSRIDALLATSPAVAAAAAERLPGDYRVVFPGVDAELFHPEQKARRIVLEWRPAER